MKLKYIINPIVILLIFVVPINVVGQVTHEEGLKKEIVIEGNVSDVNGMPLTGVGLLIKDKSNEIKTDFDGNFNLKASEGTVLIISCSGFKTKEITVGNQSIINITLEDEVKSENIRALTKADIRKKRRSDNKARRVDNKARHKAQIGKNVENSDLGYWLLEATGRSIKGEIRKNRNN